MSIQDVTVVDGNDEKNLINVMLWPGKSSVLQPVLFTLPMLTL